MNKTKLAKLTTITNIGAFFGGIYGVFYDRPDYAIIGFSIHGVITAQRYFAQAEKIEQLESKNNYLTRDLAEAKNNLDEAESNLEKLAISSTTANSNLIH